jgi:predicted HicB family RNase H-like nuclease
MVMAEREEEAWVQLATRIPKSLHRELKLHCVSADVSVMDFVVQALRDRLSRLSGRKRGRSAD